MIEIRRTMTLSQLLAEVIYEFDLDQNGTYARKLDSSVTESTAFSEFMVRTRYNKTIALIKAVRKVTGWGLREAKRFVDNAKAYEPQTLESALMLGVTLEPPF